MSHDGLPARADTGSRAARADRRAASRRDPRVGRLAAWSALSAALVVAIAACGSGSSASGGVAASTGTPAAAASVEPSLETSPSASAPTGITLAFQAANGSQISGGAVLTDLGDGTTSVTIGLVAVDFTEPLRAVLEQGSCATMAAGASGSAGTGASESPGASGGESAGASGGTSAGASLQPSAAMSEEPSAASSAAESMGASESGATSSGATSSAAVASPVTGPPFQLTDVTNGASNTVVQTTNSALLAEPFAIVVTKSATDTTVVACADVTNTGVSVPGASGLESALPSLESALPSLESALPSLAASLLPSSS